MARVVLSRVLNIPCFLFVVFNFLGVIYIMVNSNLAEFICQGSHLKGWWGISSTVVCIVVLIGTSFSLVIVNPS